MVNTVEKYGTLPQDIRFELMDWVLVVPAEDPAGKGLDCIHACRRKDKSEEKTFISWSYAIPGDSHCPGCGAVMPEEVQGLYQMSNFDNPARLPAGWLTQSIDREMKRMWLESWKSMSLTGSGAKITGVTVPE
jgi:hypothetical protein